MTAIGRIKNLLGPGEGLYQRTVRSGAWAFALRIAERVLGIIRLGILARILAPNDFGVLGIALLTMAVLETFSQTGFHAALIQKKGETKEYLDATWTFSALRGIALFCTIFVAAPYASSFFDAPSATPIIRVIGICILLRGLTSVGVIYFSKDLNFSKQFVYMASGTIADFAVAVSTALILKSVWALVLGLLAGWLVRLVVGYLIHPYRPRWSLDFGKARELFSYGKWILGTAVLMFVSSQGDDIFVGKALGVTFLGLYQMAYQISNMPATEVTQVISQVAFPAYSKVQDTITSLREGYLRTLQLTAFISIPLAGGILMVAPEFTRIFLGAKWMPMVSAMQVLALWGLVRSLAATMGPVLMAVGKPDIVTKLGVVRVLVLAALIYPFSMRWGIAGTSWAVVLSSFSTAPILYHIVVRRILNASRVHLAAVAMLVPLIAALLMVLLLSFFTDENASALGFALHVLGGATFYFALSYGLDRLLKCGLRDNLRSVLLALR